MAVNITFSSALGSPAIKQPKDLPGRLHASILTMGNPSLYDLARRDDFKRPLCPKRSFLRSFSEFP